MATETACGCGCAATGRPHELVISEDGRRRYRMRSTLASSARFGPCEVCGENASEVFIQWRATRAPASEGEPAVWIRPTAAFGHQRCLVALRTTDGEP